MTQPQDSIIQAVIDIGRYRQQFAPYVFIALHQARLIEQWPLYAPSESNLNDADMSALHFGFGRIEELTLEARKEYRRSKPKSKLLKPRHFKLLLDFAERGWYWSMP